MAHEPKAGWPAPPENRRTCYVVVRQQRTTAEIGKLHEWQILEVEYDRQRALEAIQETLGEQPETAEDGEIRLLKVTPYDLRIRHLVEAVVTEDVEAAAP